ncbi:MAG TPA: hypothetical protein VF649_09885 [Sphingomonas sp.]|jgi:hypothetical protein|uniref:hypothetical protein n=1 Tax=Sphingomonas sp. TaxID=28214 RepID=UPI002EDB7D4B
MKRLSVAAGIVLLSGAGAAQAQYRPDVPEVLEPQPVVDAGASSAGTFRAAYARQGSPRVALFWNRVLTDEARNQYVERLNLRSRSGVLAARNDDGEGGEAAGAVSVHEIDATRGTVRAPEAARASMDEVDDWKVGAAFNGVLRAAGVRLIDRSLMMRVGARQTGQDDNLQAVETSALMGKADVLMEVLQTPDPASPIGYSFRVDIKDILSGAVIASLVEDGENRSPRPGRFVAGPSGFVRSTPAPFDLDDMGRSLARRVMTALAAQWR